MNEPINTGGPAFPRPAGDYNGTKHGNGAQSGMTLRDYFAARAMQGFCAYGALSDPDHSHTIDDVAADAYDIADAMLKAREGGAR